MHVRKFAARERARGAYWQDLERPCGGHVQLAVHALPIGARGRRGRRVLWICVEGLRRGRKVGVRALAGLAVWIRCEVCL